MIAAQSSIVPDPPEEHGLNAAREKVMGETGKSFNVDKILVESRVRREREAKNKSQEEKKLHQEIAVARLKGDHKRVHELEEKHFQHIKEQSHDLDVGGFALGIEKARLKADTQNGVKGGGI